MIACQISQRLIGDIDNSLPMWAKIPVSVGILEARFIA